MVQLKHLSSLNHKNLMAWDLYTTIEGYMDVWRNRHTRWLQVPVPKGVRFRIPPHPPMTLHDSVV